MADAAAQSKPTPTTPTDGRLNVKVFSPYQTYYAGDAVSVSGLNQTGPFDVLFAHANFFSLLAAGDVVVRTGFAQLNFPVSRGIIKVSSNKVTVFVDL